MRSRAGCRRLHGRSAVAVVGHVVGAERALDGAASDIYDYRHNWGKKRGQDIDNADN